jgi:hypothetical protein
MIRSCLGLPHRLSGCVWITRFIANANALIVMVWRFTTITLLARDYLCTCVDAEVGQEFP